MLCTTLIQRRLAEAYTLLHTYGDTNSAIIALSLNKNLEAQTIMQGVKSATPLAEYVRALIAARFKQAAELFSHLPNACNDPKLRSHMQRAAFFRAKFL